MKWHRTLSVYFLITLIPVSLSSVGCSGGPLGNWFASPEARRDEAKFLELYRELHRLVDDHAIGKTPTEAEFRYEAAKGFMRALNDPYSAYFTPEETRKLKERMNGSDAGIGVAIKPSDDLTPIVTEVMQDSPAIKAGLIKGDRIIAIDNAAANAYSLEVAVQRIKGKAGSKVKLTVVREGAAQPLTFDIIREVMERVRYRAEKRVGIIVIPHFGDATPDEFFTATRKLLYGGAERFIVDLRNNPGGLLASSVLIAGAWSNESRLVTTLQEKNDRATHFSKLVPVSLEGKRTVLLVNGASASASEVLAGALHDWGSVTLIGTKTFGKGIVQNGYAFPDGSSVHITSSYWLTPKGEKIHGKGIAPDIRVEVTPDDERSKRDPQMARAIEFLETGK